MLMLLREHSPVMFVAMPVHFSRVPDLWYASGGFFKLLNFAVYILE